MPDNEYLAAAAAVVKFIFSWVILLPIAIIISGKFLTRPVSLKVNSKQLFKLSFGILKIQATDEEVILGFAGFIITLFISAMYGGKDIYEAVKSGFGIDPGHFNSLCIFSSFSMVLWSCFLFIVIGLSSSIFGYFKPRELRERDDLIEKLRQDKEEKQDD